MTGLPCLCRFDSEMSKVTDQLKAEKTQREKLQREKEELATQKYTTEQELKVSSTFGFTL